MQTLELDTDPNELWKIFKKIFWTEKTCENDSIEAIEEENDMR